jgi:hypothetical protein
MTEFKVKWNFWFTYETRQLQQKFVSVVRVDGARLRLWGMSMESHGGMILTGESR